MKKILAVILALVMVLSFAACGAKPTAKFVISDAVNDAVLYEFEAEIEEGKTAGAMIEEYLTANEVDYTIYDGDMLASIGELEQDAENWSVYWACYYNSEYATVGLWGYVPAEGDLIEVKFEESTW
ncbi:MAG: DUF4430 domain-containing protein [Oscillospiraceae bacterium]|nr:DUF4430 domain-containing protein [Oscillospiraceae bacterium]